MLYGDRTMNKLLRVLILLVFFGLGISCASAANVVSFNPQTVELLPGSSQNVQIVMDEIPNGLSGFNITFTIIDPEIAEITAVSHPTWAILKSNSTTPSSSVWIKASDLTNITVPGNTNVPFGTITIKGKKAGTTDLNITGGYYDPDGDFSEHGIPGVIKGSITVLDIESPVINSVSLNNSEPGIGDSILVTVNATDNIGISSVKANNISLVQQGGSIWTGSITALEGTHSVNVSAEDAAGNIAWNNSTSYTAVTKPVTKPHANFTSNVTSGNPPLFVYFNDSSLNADNITWDFGDGTPTSNESNPIHMFEDSGIYTVNLTATNTNGTDTKSATITVFDIQSPVINSVILSNSEAKTGDSILVTVNATDNLGVSRVKANGISLTKQGGSIWNGSITALEGTHSVNISAEDAAGNIAWNNSTSYTAVTPIIPVANFSSNVTEGYIPLYVQFNDSSINADNITWDFGDGSPASNESNPIHVFNNPRIYTVNLTATNANGTDTKSATITVKDPLSYTIDKIVLNITDSEGKLKEDRIVTTAGDVINYQVNVRNDGIFDLNNVTVTDSLIKDKLTLSNSSINNDTVLNAGEIWTYGGNYTITEEDINQNGTVGDGFIINNATVVCNELGPKTDTEKVSIQSFHYIIYKAVISPDDNGDCIVNSPGDEIPYRIVVKNDGSKVLHNFTVNDSKVNLTAQISELSPKEIWEQNVTYKLTQADMNNASENNDWNVTNTLNVSCKELSTLKSITIKTPIAKKPILSIYKSTIGIDEAGDKIINKAGDIINYQVVVKNTGTVKFTNINVSDPMVPKLTKVAGDHDNDDFLDPGELWEFRGNYTVTENDTNNDFIINTATVSYINDTNVTQSASSTLVLPVIKTYLNTSESKVLPVADFNATPSSGYAPLSVQFTDNSQNAESRSWDFNNDGVTDSTNKTSVYIYSTPGTYTANLAVRNANGTASKSTTINVLTATSSSSSSGSSGGSKHSSGGSSGSVTVSSSTATPSDKTDSTGSATVTQAQNNTPIKQNNESTVTNVEQTTVQNNNTSIPAKESKKTPSFEIALSIFCLLSVFLYKRR
jgi:uncharacterized repeat protein (TIGR01451 family)